MKIVEGSSSSVGVLPPREDEYCSSVVVFSSVSPATLSENSISEAFGSSDVLNSSTSSRGMTLTVNISPFTKYSNSPPVKIFRRTESPSETWYVSPKSSPFTFISPSSKPIMSLGDKSRGSDNTKSSYERRYN